jgi:hypothetical protein
MPDGEPSEATLGGEQVVSGASHGQPFTSEVTRNTALLGSNANARKV